jgi:hypothetical protein
MTDHGMICGPRRRSRVHVALNTAFTAFALAALLYCIGEACGDLLHRSDWYSHFAFCAKTCVAIGLIRLGWLGLSILAFVVYHRLAARYPALLKLGIFKDAAQ